MFCVECGKKNSVFKEGLCVECYLKKHQFTEGPKYFDMPFCPHCGSIKYKNTWTHDTFSDVLKRYVNFFFNFSKELSRVDIDTDCIEEKELIRCKIYITGLVENVEISENHEVLVRLKNDVCDACSKRFGGYHEAIIQVRAEERDLNSDELDRIVFSVEKMINDMQARGNREAFISEMGEEHGGFDFFISDREAASAIVRNLQDQFGGKIKKSSKNTGMEDGQQVYRMTYLLRIPSFKKDDYVTSGKSLYRILSVSKNKVQLFDLSNWEKKVLDIDKSGELEVIGGKEIEQEMIVVSQNKDEIQVMDQENYGTVSIRKPKHIKVTSDTVVVVKTKDHFFLLPEEN
ncbi:MAG: 60S ribosomal export protein NMD3 [Candidatus Thermoplasmatota archaeon]